MGIIYSFLTLGLHRVTSSDRFAPWKESHFPLCRMQGGPQCRWVTVPVSHSAGEPQCRWATVPVSHSAGGPQCRWATVPVRHSAYRSGYFCEKKALSPTGIRTADGPVHSRCLKRQRCAGCYNFGTLTGIPKTTAIFCIHRKISLPLAPSHPYARSLQPTQWNECLKHAMYMHDVTLPRAK